MPTARQASADSRRLARRPRERLLLPTWRLQPTTTRNHSQPLATTRNHSQATLPLFFCARVVGATRNTSRRAAGLDEAVLGFSAGTDPESDATRIASLLRHGAHGLLASKPEGEVGGDGAGGGGGGGEGGFAKEDINQVEPWHPRKP
jgi:hypothetical protein